MENRKGGGAKLNRTEIVYVRFDPMVHLGAQLAAARERRTLSSFIECAVEERMKVISSGVEGRSVWNVIEEIWHPEPAIRFVQLAFRYPHLLSHSELLLWEMVCNRPFFWLGGWSANRVWFWHCNPQSLIVDRLIEHWSTLNRVQAGELDESALPRIQGEPGTEAPVFSGQPYPQPSFGGEPAVTPPPNHPLEAGRQPVPPNAPSGQFVHARSLRSGETSPNPEFPNKPDTRRKV